MATIFTINSVAEMVIAGLLTLSVTPMLLRLKNKGKNMVISMIFFPLVMI